ncbi:MAG: LamG-like jellyroll fold domain-containing protein [Planctomycetia bacterium]|nr:LamG-like jellyroll fold domain-containing protein [Planctomycetia bacterium]
MSDLQYPQENGSQNKIHDGNTAESLKNHPLYLAEQYVSGTITDEELTVFLALLEKNEDFARHVRKNMFVDFLLHEKYKLADTLQKAEKEEKEEAGGSIEDLEKLLDDLVAYEKTAIPCPVPIIQTEEKKKENPFIVFLKKGIPGQKRIITEERKHTKGSNLLFILSFTLLIVLCTGLTIDHYLDQKRNSPVSFSGIAQIEEMIDAVWKPGSEIYKRNQYLETNKLDLQSGTVKIRFKNEAQLILEGPSECVINGSKSLYCNHGSLSASISKEANGFSIITPFATFTDRGTEFAVNVDAKTSRLDMIKGSADVFSAEKMPPLNIKAGSAALVDLARKPEIKPCLESNYISSESFFSRLEHWVKKKQEEENAEFLQRKKDPSLLVYLNFNEGVRNRIPNLSEQGYSLMKEAQIMGCATDKGRYYSTNSVRFRNRRDLISLGLTGSWRNLTLIATVRLDVLRSNGNVLFADKQYVSEPSTFLWQILNDGRIRFQLHGKSKTSDTQFEYFDSQVAFTSRQLGTWSQLAVVADSDRKRISHYLDGKLLGSSPWNNPQLLKVIGATLGNVQDFDRGVASRYFGGTIEDFSFYDRALAPEELKKISKP